MTASGLEPDRAGRDLVPSFSLFATIDPTDRYQGLWERSRQVLQPGRWTLELPYMAETTQLFICLCSSAGLETSFLIGRLGTPAPDRLTVPPRCPSDYKYRMHPPPHASTPCSPPSRPRPRPTGTTISLSAVTERCSRTAPQRSGHTAQRASSSTVSANTGTPPGQTFRVVALAGATNTSSTTSRRTG